MNTRAGKITCYTATWMRNRSIFSIIKPTFDIIFFQDLWRFAEIWVQNCFLLFLNNFRHLTITIFCSYQPPWLQEQYHVKWRPRYRNIRSVSWKLSCNAKTQFIFVFKKTKIWTYWTPLTIFVCLDTNKTKHQGASSKSVIYLKGLVLQALLRAFL